jgi:hypothetical protein
MDEQVWILVQQVAFIVVAIAGGGLLVPVINFTKGRRRSQRKRGQGYNGRVFLDRWPGYGYRRRLD